MAATLTTLNVSVAQIESDLRAGKTVAEISQDWSEPPANVYAVQRAMQARGDSNGHAAASPKPPVAPPVAAGARPAANVSPSAPAVAPVALSVDALVAAAARSTSKRTQALGVKLHDLAAVVRQRLADERATAEREAKERAEREAAAAEVARLEAQLREARAKLSKRRGGSGTVRKQPDSTTRKPLSDRQREVLAANREKAFGEWPCRNGCGRVSTTAAGRSSHERNCTGVAS